MAVLTIDEARQSLESLVERAIRGERIRIEVNGKFLELHSVDPDLPPDYLRDCYGSEEIAEENYFAGFAPRSTST